MPQTGFRFRFRWLFALSAVVTPVWSKVVTLIQSRFLVIGSLFIGLFGVFLKLSPATFDLEDGSAKLLGDLFPGLAVLLQLLQLLVNSLGPDEKSGSRCCVSSQLGRCQAI
jgi:hypothetical protein